MDDDDCNGNDEEGNLLVSQVSTFEEDSSFVSLNDIDSSDTRRVASNSRSRVTPRVGVQMTVTATNET